MLDQFGNVLYRPFREEIPAQTMLLYIILYAVAAWAVYDALRVLAAWAKEAG